MEIELNYEERIKLCCLIAKEMGLDSSAVATQNELMDIWMKLAYNEDKDSYNIKNESDDEFMERISFYAFCNNFLEDQKVKDSE